MVSMEDPDILVSFSKISCIGWWSTRRKPLLTFDRINLTVMIGLVHQMGKQETDSIQRWSCILRIVKKFPISNSILVLYHF